MDYVVFSETFPNIKKEFEGDVYLDDKVFTSETTMNIASTELNRCSKDDQTKPCLVSTDVKSELSPSNVTDHNTIVDRDIKQELPSTDLNLYNTMIDDNVKVENDVVGDIKVISHDNKWLYCNNCNAYYEEYCTKCGMLLWILNGNGFNNSARKEIPSNILEIKEGLFQNNGVFALKTIPKGVKFGPFTGFSTAKSSWKLKGGKFVVSNDNSEVLNWMKYVNCARSVSDQNLYVFQYEDILYYRSVCEIHEGEELLVYFGEEYEESLNNNIEMHFIPRIETDVVNVFACTYCCLGFSLKAYLVEHKTFCPNRTNGNFEELVQCSFCKTYLEKKEYLEYHETHCRKRNAKHCVLPPLDDHTLEEKIISSVTNKHEEFKLTQYKYIGNSKIHINRDYEVKTFRCEICYKKFKKKQSLKFHMKNIHIVIKHKGDRGDQFKCLRYKFQTNCKYYLKSHVKTKHLREKDYNCGECEYKTNTKSNLQRHVKIKHLKEKNYNCMECEYKTINTTNLQMHIKIKHLKENDFNCGECGYKTNYKTMLEAHIKTKHLKEYDYNCVECEYKTNNKRNLLRHVTNKHFKEYSFNCMKCEYKTNEKLYLQEHMKTKHLKEYDYNCMECEYKTNNKSNLLKHIRIKHLKEKNYNCMECEYKTTNKSNLQMHTKTKHRKENYFNCEQCEYKTNYKSVLEAHVKTKHLKEYDYNCVECEYKTNNKSNLQKHIKIKHLKAKNYNYVERE